MDRRATVRTNGGGYTTAALLRPARLGASVVFSDTADARFVLGGADGMLFDDSSPRASRLDFELGLDLGLAGGGVVDGVVARGVVERDLARVVLVLVERRSS